MTTPTMPLLDLSDDERATVGALRGQITTFAKKNLVKNKYYEGKHKARSLDIAVPPSLSDLEVQVDHPATIVDVLAERILWDGWSSSGDLLGLDQIFKDNDLGIEQSQATIDALICGVAFASVGKGDVNEPEVLITAESPSSATIQYSQRLRRAEAALSQTRNDYGTVIMESLYLPNETIRFERGPNKKLVVVDRDRHNLNRVAMVRLTNQERASDRQGRSEITRAIRYYTDATARTLLGMEINREFYTAPQRYGLGVDPEQFGLDESSTKGQAIKRGWEISMSRMNFIPRDEDTGELPQVGQFAQSSPEPYIAMNRHYAQLLAAAAAIPLTHLGFGSDNPPSADAIRAMESRLVKRAELRQRMFGRAWIEAGRLALLTMAPNEFDENAFSQIGINWLSAATATPAADADRVTKLTAGDTPIVPPTSAVAARMAGLSKQEQEEIGQDRRRETIARLATTIQTAAQNPPAPAGAPTVPARSGDPANAPVG